MTEQPKRGVGSKILRDRAMAVLRDTRAKLDPQFLSAMRDHLSMLMSSGMGKPSLGKDEDVKNSKPPSFADEMKAQNKTETASLKSSAPSSYPVQSFDDLPEIKNDDKSEPVDQQKIAKIVLEYMKNRQDGQRH